MNNVWYYWMGLYALSSIASIAGGMVFLKWGMNSPQYALTVALSWGMGVFYTLAYWGLF